MQPDFSIYQSVGVAGFAIWIMYLMYKGSSQRFKEKDQELLSEIEKRDARNDLQQRTFTDYTMKLHESTTSKLSENTVALMENTRVMQEVTKHMNITSPVIIQNNTGEKK